MFQIFSRVGKILLWGPRALKKKIEKRGKMLLAEALAPMLGRRGSAAVPPDPVSVRKLLVIRQHNQMGDMLLAVPAFRGIRKKFPNAWITLLAADINSGVMRNNPFVDEVVTWSKKRNRKDPLAFIRFVRGLRSERFDLLIVLNTVSFSVTSMLLGAVSGAAWRAGSSSAPFGSELTSKYYDLELPLPDEDELALMHESEHNLFPLRALGIEEDDLSSMLVPLDWEERACGEFIAASFGSSPYAVIHPGAGKVQNIWPPERFAEVSDVLLDRHGIRSIAVRGPVDDIFFTRFLEACQVPPQVISCPTTGFLGALMRKAAVSVCNDTGVAHIAGAVGAWCVEVFGPTDPHRWKPVSEAVVAVTPADGRIDSVTTGEVLEAVEELLAREPVTGAGSC
jgi:ADP-heptose:LPS heptosyltransferase